MTFGRARALGATTNRLRRSTEAPGLTFGKILFVALLLAYFFG